MLQKKIMGAVILAGTLLGSPALTMAASTPATYAWQGGAGGNSSQAVILTPAMGMAQDAGFIYTIKNSNTIEKTNKVDGSLVWSQPINLSTTFRDVIEVKVDDSNIYVLGSAGVQVYDKAAGSFTKEAQVCTLIGCAYNANTVFKSIEVSADSIYVTGTKMKSPMRYKVQPTYSASVVKLNKADLTLAWEKNFVAESSTVSGPSAFDAASGKIYVSIMAGRNMRLGSGSIVQYLSAYLISVNAADGAQISSDKLTYYGNLQSMYAGTDGVYLVGRAVVDPASFTAVDMVEKRSLSNPATVLWQSRPDNAGGFTSRIVTQDDEKNVYVLGTTGTTGTAFRLNQADGTTLGQVSLKSVPVAAAFNDPTGAQHDLITLGQTTSNPYAIDSIVAPF
jgi:hypothetical protein